MSEAPVTREQLDELERALRPVIAKFLDEAVSDTTVAITCTPVRDDPDGASVMRFDVKVRGESITPEQEEKVARLLRSSGDPNIVKAKAPSVY
jgi:hypothetical protein